MDDKKSHLDEVLNFIESASIKYALLREKSTIENIISNKNSIEDIDIYVDFNKAPKLIEYLSLKGFVRLLPNQLYINIDSGLKIDVHYGTYLRLPFPSEEFFLQNTEKVDGWSYLNKNSLFLVLLLHPLDLAGFRGQRQYTRDKLEFLNSHQNLILDNEIKNYIESWLGKYFYKKIAELLLFDPSHIINHYAYLKLFAMIQSKDLYKFQLKRLKRNLYSKVRRKGLLISIMGIDGSGKTTLSNNLNQFLNNHYKHRSSDVIYMGMLGPYILPINKLSDIYRAILRKEKSNEDRVNFDEINSMSMARKIKQRLLILLIGVDLVLRNLIVFWKLNFLRKILITDRSIFDQHTKFNFNFVLKIVRFLSIKPSCFIFLKGDTNEIYKRKKEYTPSELQKHQNLHLDFLKNNYSTRLQILDASQTRNKLLANSLRLIMQEIL